jgi:Fe2+ transport system protein FeoA
MKKTLSSTKLNKIKASESFCIQKIPDEIKYELIRLGISEGDYLFCVAKIPFGAVVIQKDLQEIAIGSRFASLIEVTQGNEV